MIYRCGNGDCGYISEEAAVRCPSCGGVLAACAEDALSGDDWTRLGIRHLREKTGDGARRAYECLQRAAMGGSAWGVSNLGWCLETGTGTAADPRQAIWLYRQAAELGYHPAFASLGYCYENGIGTAVDEEEAAACYREGA